MQMKFVRLDDHDPPCLVLVEPQSPAKPIRKRLTAAGFEFWAPDVEWWIPLSDLGRSNISDARALAALSDAGIVAEVVRRTCDEHYGTRGGQVLPEDLEPGRVFTQGGKDHYMDPARKVLVPATPEEHVRQRLLNFLMRDLGYPLKLLETEYPLARWVPRARGRTDVLIWNPTLEDPTPWAVIECKKDGWDLNDEVWDQVRRYGLKLGAQIIGVTNGERLECRRRASATARYCEGNSPLETFEEVLAGVEPPTWLNSEVFRRPSHKKLEKRKTVLAYTDEFCVVHSEEPAERVGPIINLGSLLLDPSESPGEMLGCYPVTEDLGVRKVHFGNAGFSSQAYSGAYRTFILDVDGDHQVVSFRVWAVDYGGNTSILAVGTDKGDQPHHALQLNLRRYMTLDVGLARLRHDGRMALGEGGSIRSGDVLEFVRERAPDLVAGDQIDLGTFPTTELVTWANSAEMFGRLVRYVFLRDELRKLRRSGLR